MRNNDNIKQSATPNSSGTYSASFRISKYQHDAFEELLERVPGSDVGNMYREIFARGLKSMQAFYAQQGFTDDSDEEKGA